MNPPSVPDTAGHVSTTVTLSLKMVVFQTKWKRTKHFSPKPKHRILPQTNKQLHKQMFSFYERSWEAKCIRRKNQRRLFQKQTAIDLQIPVCVMWHDDQWLKVKNSVSSLVFVLSNCGSYSNELFLSIVSWWTKSMGYIKSRTCFPLPC